MPRCSDDSSIAQPIAAPMTRPSSSATNVVNVGSSKPSSHSLVASSRRRGPTREKTGERPWCSGSDDVQPAEDRDVAALGAPDREPGRRRERSRRPPARRGSRGRAAARTRPGTRRRRAPRRSPARGRNGWSRPSSTQPAGGEAVEVADDLGLARRRGRRPRPTCSDPTTAARGRAEQVADHLAAAHRDGTRRAVLGRRVASISARVAAGSSNRGVEPGLHDALRPMASGEQPRRVVDERRRVNGRMSSRPRRSTSARDRRRTTPGAHHAADPQVVVELDEVGALADGDAPAIVTRRASPAGFGWRRRRRPGARRRTRRGCAPRRRGR